MAGRKVGVVDPQVNRFTSKALFSTLTNVDFDPARFQQLIAEAVKARESLKAKVAKAGGNVSVSDPATTFQPASGLEALVKQGEVRLPIDWDRDEDVRSLQETTLYGLRGTAAYADHAAILGQEDDSVYTFIHETMAS